MAGHSKWANIQHRKGRQDEKRSASFSKIAKEITVSAKMGGGDAAFNPRLRLAVDKAKGVNMPKDKIDNAIKKGTGELEGVDYVEIRYEGYGIGGAAVIVDCLTDNKTRTVADVRHAFNKYGGNLGTDGCVAFQFKHCGQLLFAPGTDEGALMDAAIEAGADDVLTNDDGSVEVITAPNDYMAVKDALEAAGFKVEFGGVTMKAENETQLGGDEALRMQKLIDALEGLDDVQEVYTSVRKGRLVRRGAALAGSFFLFAHGGSVLESSDLIFLLPPYHRNFGKRLVKTPKLYFLDVGLACWLLGIRSPDVLALHPSRGALFETWVVGEFVKGRFNLGLPADLYFWRDNNGLEADLVFEIANHLQPVEIKSGQTVTRDYVRAGQASGRFAGEAALPPWLIYGGNESCERSGVRVIGWRDLPTAAVPPEPATQ
jgi:YebC/PmpR family DNA-binding regulatory protein